MVLLAVRRQHARSGCLSVAAAIFVVLIAYEAIRYREPRSFIRHGGVPTPEAMRAQRVRTG